MFCTGPCPYRRRFVDIDGMIFLVETFKRPEPVAEVWENTNESIGLLNETSKAAGNDAPVKNTNVSERRRQNCLTGCPLPVLNAPNGESGLFEKTTKIPVFEKARIEVWVTSARVRNAAQEYATGTESTAYLLQGVVRIHQRGCPGFS